MTATVAEEVRHDAAMTALDQLTKVDLSEFENYGD